MAHHWQAFWKEDWDQTRERFAAWWQHDGLILHVLARREGSVDTTLNVQAPFFYQLSGLNSLASHDSQDDLTAAWTDPARRVRSGRAIPVRHRVWR